MQKISNTERLAVVENEVKHVRDDVQAVKTSIDLLPAKLTDVFDSRYVQKEDFSEVKATVKEINETIEPFTKLRRRLWLAVITAVIGVGFVQYVILESAREQIKSIEVRQNG